MLAASITVSEAQTLVEAGDNQCIGDDADAYAMALDAGIARKYHAGTFGRFSIAALQKR